MHIVITNIAILIAVSIVMGALAKAGRRTQNAGDDFMLCYPRALVIFMYFGFIFFLLMFIIQIGNVYQGWGLGTGSDLSTVILFGIADAALLLVSVYLTFWHLSIGGEKIYYRNGWGARREFDFHEIGKVVCKKNLKGDNACIVYGRNGKKLFTIDDSFSKASKWFTDAAAHRNIPIEKTMTRAARRQAGKYEGMTPDEKQQALKKKDRRENIIALIITAAFITWYLLVYVMN